MAEIRKIGKLYTDGKNIGKEIKQNPISGGWFVVPLDEAPDVVKRTGKFERKQKIHNELAKEIKYLKHLEGKVSKQNLDNAIKTTLEHYKKRLKGKDTITDIPEAYRHYEKDYENELRAREYGFGSRKLPEEKDYLPGGKKWNKEWENARETKFSRKEKITDKLTKGDDDTFIKKEYERLKDDISPMSEYSDTTGTGYTNRQMKAYKDYLLKTQGTTDENIINAGREPENRVSIERFSDIASGKSLNKMSLSELKEMANKYGIKTNMSKAKLISALISVFNK